jgi:hypothetical protein
VAVEAMAAEVIIMRTYKVRNLMAEMGVKGVGFISKLLEDYPICMSLEEHISKGTQASMGKVIKDMAQMEKTSGLVYQ